ncbi:MAG TPA: hypothetical protein PLR53_05025 [Bacteroidales bacterium]|nr:hypothetical protein [Bacteroidales bacterium]HQI64254.1 hypothetical protein [Bacteroidales bacterium]
MFSSVLAQLPEEDGNSALYSADWSSKGPGEFNQLQVKGLVESLAIDESDPRLQTIYAGTNASGIWKTTNGGKYWQCVSDRSGFSNVGVQDIIIDPNNPKIIYAATGLSTYGRSYGAGIIRSTNSGTSWSRINFPETNAVVKRLALKPGSSTHMVALYSQGRDFNSKENKIYVSKNAGSSWELIIKRRNRDGAKFFIDIEFEFSNTNNIYLSTIGKIINRGYSGSEIWKFTNIFCGDTIQMQHIRLDTLPGYPQLYAERVSLAIDSKNGDLYAAGNYTDVSNPSQPVQYFKLLKFITSNNTWQTVYTYNNVNHYGYNNPFSGIGIWRNELEISKKYSNVFYIGGFTIDVVDARTTPIATTHYLDQNVSYPMYGPTYHVDTRALKIAIDQNGNEIIFAGNDGGISRGILQGTSGNPVLSFNNINGLGFNITQLYGIGSPKNDKFAFGGGAQDNGGFVLDKNGKTWYHAPIGDGYDIIYHPENVQVAYITSNHGYRVIQRSINGGSSWTNPNPNGGMPSTMIDQPALNDRPITIHPNQPNFLYIGYHDLWRGIINTDFSINTWQNVTSFDNILDENQSMAALAIAPTDNNIMYIAYSEPHWKSDTVTVVYNYNTGDFDTIDNRPLIKKVWKSVDGGNTWNDLVLSGTDPYSILFNMARWYPITDIVIHPDDPQKVWITFGCFFEPGNANDRIAYTMDGGVTWQKFSCSGLPNLPINTMTAVKNSQSNIVTLFIGNDAGVWMYENVDIPQQNWVQFSNGLPRCIVTDLEYNPKAKKLRVATFGRGFWETSLDCFTSNDEIIPTGTTVEWTLNTAGSPITKVVKGSIIVNGTLIIGGYSDQTYYTLEMMQGKAIIIEKGGKLILNPYARITNHCGSRWVGIRVKGNPNAPFSDFSQHGIVEINGINSSFMTGIENADVAIATFIEEFVPDGGNAGQTSIPPEYTGGIIKALNALFENNYIDINIGPSRQRRKDVFTGCTFRTSGLLKGTPIYPFTHVLLNDNEGIKFYKNIFISDTLVFSWPIGIGIHANHSSFTVKDTLGSKNFFYNLEYGIKATAIAANRSIYTDKALFRNCLTGIYLSAMTRPKIWRSIFYINPTDTTILKPYAGLYLDHCTDYSVTENSFKKGTLSFNPGNNSSVYRIGIVVNNSGTENNLIYNNIFRNLNIGILAQNRNRNSDGSKGLTIQCNEFNAILNDIVITAATSGSDKGIKENQGNGESAVTLANNIFSLSGLSQTYNFYDVIGNLIRYFHANVPDNVYGYRIQPNINPEGNLLNEEKNFTFNKETCCPSEIFLGDKNAEDLKSDFYTLNDSINLLQLELSQLTDGGDTPGTVMDISTGGPNQTLEVYQSLLSKSPYLSDTSLIESVLNEWVLPNPALRDILLLNPQSAKIPEVVEGLDYRWQPFPEEMKAEVMENREVTGPKEQLEIELSALQKQQWDIYSSIVDIYDTSQVSTATDSLIAFLQHQPILVGKYILASLLLYQGLPQQSLQILQQIPTLPNIENSDLCEAEQQLTLYYWFNARSDSGLPFILADSSIAEILWQLASNSGSRASLQALNILLANNLTSYEEPYLLPQPSLKRGEKYLSQNKTATLAKNTVEIYPNPARDYLIVRYNLDNEYLPAKLLFYNAEGKPVLQQTLSRTVDELFMPVRHLNPGLYKIVIFGNKTMLLTSKFVIY